MDEMHNSYPDSLVLTVINLPQEEMLLKIKATLLILGIYPKMQEALSPLVSCIWFRVTKQITCRFWNSITIYISNIQLEMLNVS